MLWRVQCTFQKLSLAVVLLAAVALLSCGGGLEGDSVTGVSVLSELPPVADGGEPPTFVRSDDDKILICHKGEDQRVPPEAAKGHLRHGDTLGSCSAAASSCPCFDQADIDTAAGTCGTFVTSTCSVGDPYYLLMSCDPGGSVPPSVLGIYLTQTSTGGYCYRDDVFGTIQQSGLTDAEYQACVDVVSGSGYCL